MNTEKFQASLQFTEQMKGHLTSGEANPSLGAISADKFTARVTLTIHVDDVDTFIEHKDHEASITGKIHLDQHQGLDVEAGIFNLFVDTDENTKKMFYLLHFSDPDNQPKTLYGFKRIHNDPQFDVWSDTTTLYTYLFNGHISSPTDTQLGEESNASGVIRIYMLDFLKQLTTFRVEADKPSQQVKALGKFGHFFLGSLWEIYAEKSSLQQHTPDHK